MSNHRVKGLDQATALRLIEGIYDSALDDSRWQGLLADMADAFDAESGVLIVHDLRRGNEVNLMITSRFPVETLAEYAAHYVQYEPYVEALACAPVGVVLPGRAMISDRDLFRSEFYNDWMRYSGVRDVFGGFIERTGDWAAKFGFQRYHGTDPFEQQDANRIRPLVPHLRRAFRLRRTFGVLSAQRDSADAALDRMEQGVFLLDEQGRVTRANERALRFLRQRTGLVLRAGRLSCTHPGVARALEALVRQCVRTASGAGFAPGSALELPAPDGAALSLLVTPLRAAWDGLQGAVRAAVLVADRHRVPAPCGRAMRTLYGLTAGESRLAAALAEGLALDAAADRLAIAKATARTVLKRIFAKTQTHSQARLMRLMLALSRAPAADPPG